MQGKPVQAIKDQKIVVVGAGSAGMGVTSMLALGMQKHVSCCHCPPPPPSPAMGLSEGYHAGPQKQTG